MKQILVIIFCWISAGFAQLSAAVPEQSGPPVIVSLGSCCEVAHELRDCGVRDRAYPFDWLLTLDSQGLASLIQKDFEFFLKKDHVSLSGGAFFDNYYNMEFRHDLYGCDTSFEEYLPTIQEKYLRRIERFRQLNDYPGRVYFIRTAYPPHYPPLTASQPDCRVITAAQAKLLKDALSQAFPKLNFTLVIINYVDTPAGNMGGIDRVVGLKIGKDVASLHHVIQKLKG